MPDVTIRVKNATIYTSAFTQKQRVSVHGTSARVEVFEPPVEVVYRGWGTELYGNHAEQAWVHFSIPVPLAVNDLPSTLSAVFFYFETKQRARLTDVHVYDADIKFQEFPAVDREGDFTRKLVRDVNQFKVSRTLKYALGLSLRFQLSGLIDAGQGQERTQEPAVTILAAGAEYV